jgi:hypothetical protein
MKLTPDELAEFYKLRDIISGADPDKMRFSDPQLTPGDWFKKHNPDFYPAHNRYMELLIKMARIS